MTHWPFYILPRVVPELEEVPKPVMHTLQADFGLDKSNPPQHKNMNVLVSSLQPKACVISQHRSGSG